MERRKSFLDLFSFKRKLSSRRSLIDIFKGVPASAYTPQPAIPSISEGKVSEEINEVAYKKYDVNHSRTSTNSESSKYKISYSSSTTTITNNKCNPSDFEKIKIIGRGDVGRVFLVRHSKTQKLFAMKVLNKAVMLKRDKVKRVLAEQEILATSNHPFIVKLYHSFQSTENLYFITEFCSGGELFRVLQKLPGKRLEEDDVRFYIPEIICALEFLHLMGYIYRDLKPESTRKLKLDILLHSSGHIMLADFDLSKPSKQIRKPMLVKSQSVMNLRHNTKVLDTRACTATIRSNSFVGTEEYIAPEVITGQGHSSSVDWWTLGILMYEMLYGRTPFKGENRRVTFRNILENRLSFARSIIVSKECRSLIRELLNKNEGERLGSRAGASDVKSHIFFKNLNWALLLNRTPPIIPLIADDADTSNFRSLRESESLDFSLESSVEDTSDSNPFSQFETVSISQSQEFIDDGSEEDVGEEGYEDLEEDVKASKPSKKQKSVATRDPKPKPTSIPREKDAKLNYFELSNKKRVSVNEYKGKILIDLREFYEAGDEMKPSKKGISLSVEEYNKLKELISEIDACLK